MFKTDFVAFDAMLDEAYSLTGNGQLLTAGAKALFFKAMEEYTLDSVRQAMTAHIRDAVEGKFQPKPAHLIAQINKMTGGDGWMGAEEAWQRVPKSDQDSAMVTNEMMQSIALVDNAISQGELTGARMAFREYYEKLVHKARAEGRRPVYFASLGADILGREKTLSEAVIAKQITIDHAIELLPMSADRLLAATGIKNHPLLAGPSETGKQKIRELMLTMGKK